MSQKKGNIILFLVGLLGLLAIGLAGYFYWSHFTAVSRDKKTLTWDDCLKIPAARMLNTYPGQCVTPDGRKIVQPLSPEEQKQLQPPDETASWKGCKTDSDCVLVLQDSWNSCVICGNPNISDNDNKWVTVNQSWYYSQHKTCPPQRVMCPAQLANRLFTAKCINNVCQKSQRKETNCHKDTDCPQGYKCSANCDVNAPGGADCSVIGPPPTCIKSSL